jgi:hypothetical protein
MGGSYTYIPTRRGGAYRVGADVADEPTALVSDHWSELNSYDAMGTTDDQGRVNWRAFLFHTTLNSTQDS